MSKKLYVVVQEGGSSRELYVAAYSDEHEAEQFRVDCGENGGYATSPIIAVESIDKGGQTWINFDQVEEIVRATLNLEVAEGNRE